jgi:uncharacterized membrane protein YoaK (UPF0700 family)
MVTVERQSPSLAALLSFNGGYVDTAGFLALHGLFTAHVTGNFVTLGASLVNGTSGAIAKLLALPVFCLIIFITRLAAYWLKAREFPVLRTMLFLKLSLLLLATGLALSFGPFPDGDSTWAIATGMSLVAAMAIQNAAHRVHLAQLPPTTLMTGTTTQMMLDCADLFHGLAQTDKDLAIARLSKMGRAVLVFALGCGSAALFYGVAREWCFVLPPLLAALMLLIKTAS